MERRIIGVCEVCGGPVEERRWPPDEFGPAETVWACDRCGWYHDLRMDDWEPPVLLFRTLRGGWARKTREAIERVGYLILLGANGWWILYRTPVAPP